MIVIARGDGGVETCCAKSEEKGRTAEERKAKETEEVEGKRREWGCEAAVKRGRVRVS